MIYREAWYHSAALNDARDRLHQSFERGLITSDEFSREIHKLWQRERGTESPFKLLREDQKTGKVYITKGWVDANISLLSEIQSTFAPRFGENTLPISTSILEAWRKFPTAQKVLGTVQNRYFSLPLTLTPLESSSTHRDWLVGRVANKMFGGVHKKPLSDEDFTAWVQLVLEQVKWLVAQVERAT